MKNTRKFSNLDREETIQKIFNTFFDLVVVGGGITGAGIALDAAARGLKVVVLEKGDFASGTSGKSTKLIHGGLRYLKQFNFGLVREVGSERAILHKLAPHLVIPEKMLLPLLKGGSYGKWLTSIGLKVYDMLARVPKEDRRQMLGKKEALKQEPLLPPKILKGAGYYAEYRTDDARLTLENIKTGLHYGAMALNYAKVTNFLYENEKVAGVHVQDVTSEATFSIKSKYVINATGPWVDELRMVNQSKAAKHLHLTKGVHLVFPKEKLPVKQSVYFDLPDGRMMFAIPRGKVTYIGTTDTDFKGDKDRLTLNRTEALYLIAGVNHMFPKINLVADDIISWWAGLRPLIHKAGKSPSELSRKDEIFTSKTGLISIAGGKLTGYRKMAERVVNRIAQNMENEYKVKINPCTTDKIPFCGNDFKTYKQVTAYIEDLYNRLKAEGFSLYDARYLVTTYGKQAEILLENYAVLRHRDVHERMIRAEARFAIAFEMALTPPDFFIRRTGRLYFDINSVRKYKEPVLEEFKNAYQYNEAQILFFRKKLEEVLESHSGFSPEARL